MDPPFLFVADDFRQGCRFEHLLGSSTYIGMGLTKNPMSLFRVADRSFLAESPALQPICGEVYWVVSYTLRVIMEYEPCDWKFLKIKMFGGNVLRVKAFVHEFTGGEIINSHGLIESTLQDKWPRTYRFLSEPRRHASSSILCNSAYDLFDKERLRLVYPCNSVEDYIARCLRRRLVMPPRRGMATPHYVLDQMEKAGIVTRLT